MIEAWRDNFKQHSLKVGFVLSLSRAMVEFMSACADDVDWDRATWGATLAYPDNFLATSRSLVKRGMIERKGQEFFEDKRKNPPKTREDLHSYSCYILTPAGRHVVELLRFAGMFLEADAAILKKAKAKSK